MTVVAVLQARMSSTRLPGKVLQDLHGRPMIGRQIERIERSRNFDTLVVATSQESSDDPIVEFCESIGVHTFRGSLNDVLDRFRETAHAFLADHVIRLTADCPLTDWAVIDRVIDVHVTGSHDYTSNTIPRTYPDGLDVEVTTIEALDTAWAEAQGASEREHVTSFLYEHPQRFNIGTVTNPHNHSDMRWTVDEPEDLEFVRRVYEELYPVTEAFTWNDVLALLERHPALIEINRPPPETAMPRSPREVDGVSEESPEEDT